MADFEVNRRLKILIEEAYGVSPVEFAKKYNDPKAVKTYNILSERNGVSNKMLETIVTAYPEISKAWLLTGLGDMRSEQKNSSLDKEIIEIQKKSAEEGKAIGGSIPYEFVQALFAERKIHDEIVLSQQKTMESMQQQIKKTSVPGEDVTCAAVSGSDLTK